MPKESSEQKKDLKDLAQEIITAYDARIKVVGEIVEDTHKMIGNFRQQRENMSKELREILAKCESLRKKDFDRMMAGIVMKQNEREEGVKKMLEDFRKEEEAVAEKIKNLLGKGEKVRIGDLKKMMGKIKKEQGQRTVETSASITEQLQKMQKEVHTMLGNFKKERQSVASAWNETIDFLNKEKSQAKSNVTQVKSEILAKNIEIATLPSAFAEAASFAEVATKAESADKSVARNDSEAIQIIS